MSNPWFRMYSEFSHDPKVQMMSEAMQRRYIMFMCLRCSNSLVTLQETEIAFHLRISETDMAETKALFISKGFIDESFNLLNWEKRQFSSDTSKARVAKHRALQKEKQQEQSNGNVTLLKRNDNALDTDTDTDTEPEKKKEKTSAIAPPDGVVESVWTDFVELRKSKKAKLTQTAIDGIKHEADSAGWTLENALRECCARGWTGFKADWVADKPKARESPTGETAYQRSMRERVAEFSPSIARQAPGVYPLKNMILEAENVTAIAGH